MVRWIPTALHDHQICSRNQFRAVNDASVKWVFNPYIINDKHQNSISKLKLKRDLQPWNMIKTETLPIIALSMVLFEFVFAVRTWWWAESTLVISLRPRCGCVVGLRQGHKSPTTRCGDGDCWEDPEQFSRGWKMRRNELKLRVFGGCGRCGEGD